jgi:hypothetical protein
MPFCSPFPHRAPPYTYRLTCTHVTTISRVSGRLFQLTRFTPSSFSSIPILSFSPPIQDDCCLESRWLDVCLPIPLELGAIADLVPATTATWPLPVALCAGRSRKAPVSRLSAVARWICVSPNGRFVYSDDRTSPGHWTDSRLGMQNGKQGEAQSLAQANNAAIAQQAEK